MQIPKGPVRFVLAVTGSDINPHNVCKAGFAKLGPVLHQKLLVEDVRCSREEEALRNDATNVLLVMGLLSLTERDCAH